MILWLKISLGSDTRCTRFLCPSPADSSGVSRSKTKCPYTPPGQTTPPPSGGPVVGAGRCLDVPDLSHANGAQVQLRNCSGDTSQQWVRPRRGTCASTAPSAWMPRPPALLPARGP
ncbi:RICIN domain-containing protein [Streptomyces coeruleorubidus]|uniref:RICIN domain-containing protein n=1 Tax=Streptomyces coeruleorubidus TaxID=116188 RepID=UPI0037FBD668